MFSQSVVMDSGILAKPVIGRAGPVGSAPE